MKHDFSASTDKAADERFLAWLETETIDGLMRSYGDGEATKAMVFLFAHRACESRMSERQIWNLFAVCMVRAGYREEQEGPGFDILEASFEIARLSFGGN